MEPPIVLCICYQMISHIILLTATLNIIISRLCKIILIHEVIASVIRRIDINHLDLAKVVLTQKLQYIKVVTFYVEIFSIVEVHTFLSARTQCLADRSISGNNGLFLPGPGELIALVITFYYVTGEFLSQLIKINSNPGLPPPECVQLYSWEIFV